MARTLFGNDAPLASRISRLQVAGKWPFKTDRGRLLRQSSLGLRAEPAQLRPDLRRWYNFGRAAQQETKGQMRNRFPKGSRFANLQAGASPFDAMAR